MNALETVSLCVTSLTMYAALCLLAVSSPAFARAVSALIMATNFAFIAWAGYHLLVMFRLTVRARWGESECARRTLAASMRPCLFFSFLCACCMLAACVRAACVGG